jgi:N-acetyl sugar amidotransferase
VRSFAENVRKIESEALMANKQICSRCVIDSAVPGVSFDADGICNYCRLHETLEREWPMDDAGQQIIDGLVQKMKAQGRGKRYDCVVGVSGGTDSTYLLYWAKQQGLRPLAVHFDNGWDSEIAVSNIKKSISLLGVDLQTYVVDWEEFKDILVSFLWASFPWADAPTDLAIHATLYRVAAEEGVRYILNGSSFRTEGKMPVEWTYLDGRTVRHIHKTFGKRPMNTYPNLMLWDYAYYGVIRRIQNVRPLNFVDYHKDQARQMLTREIGWQYYGGHHYENIYTRFAYSYLLPEKFKIDKRIITHSALVRSGEMTREEALVSLAQPPYPPERVQEDVAYVIKKLGLSGEEFEEIMAAPPKSFRDYPSYYPLIERYTPLIRRLLKLALPWTPPMLHEMDARRGTQAPTPAAKIGE